MHLPSSYSEQDLIRLIVSKAWNFLRRRLIVMVGQGARMRFLVGNNGFIGASVY